MQSNTPTSPLLKPYHHFILFLLISLGAFTATLFTPALPELSRYFQISETKAQWTMSIFLVGYAIGQLPFGPIANRFGRKKAIYIGIVLSLLGNALSFATSIFWVLCLGRFIQALGAAVGLKITFTMVADQHSGPKAAKVLAWAGLAFGVMPGVGVAIGGFITVLWGWKGCFIFSALYAALLGFLCLTLPETAKKFDKEALQLHKIIHGYSQQFKSAFTVCHGLFIGLFASTFYIFATVAPYIGIDHIGLRPDHFGLWNLIPPIGLFIGILLQHYIAEKIQPLSILLLSCLTVLSSILIMTLCFSFGWVTAATLFVPAFLMRIGNMPGWSTASSQGLSQATDKSNASAVMQFTGMSIATIANFLIELFSPTNPMLLPLALGASALCMLALWFKLRKLYQMANP